MTLIQCGVASQYLSRLRSIILTSPFPRSELGRHTPFQYMKRVSNFLADFVEDVGFNSAITKPVECARNVVEMGSHPTKRFLFNHTTPFSTKGLEKSLCDSTGTIFVQCENHVFIHQTGHTEQTHKLGLRTQEPHILPSATHQTKHNLSCLNNTWKRTSVNIYTNNTQLNLSKQRTSVNGFSMIDLPGSTFWVHLPAAIGGT